MLVLLIVFMVTARFVQESGVSVNLPKASAGDSSALADLVVTLGRDGSASLGGRELDLAALGAVLETEARANPGVRVSLAADEDLPYKTVVSALDAVKRAGVTRVALAARR
ncbi:MAG: biopolymer transporter ExbD [Elusimicrobiota bacterium]|nr:MAG: biopolymer transporter ExbD [Elusimicrobiota bacterium]